MDVQTHSSKLHENTARADALEKQKGTGTFNPFFFFRVLLIAHGAGLEYVVK